MKQINGCNGRIPLIQIFNYEPNEIFDGVFYAYNEHNSLRAG